MRLAPLTTCAASASVGPSVPIAARRSGSGPMAPVLPNACGWPVPRSVARTVGRRERRRRAPPRRSRGRAALAATIGDALEVPPNVARCTRRGAAGGRLQVAVAGRGDAVAPALHVDACCRSWRTRAGRARRRSLPYAQPGRVARADDDRARSRTRTSCGPCRRCRPGRRGSGSRCPPPRSTIRPRARRGADRVRTAPAAPTRPARSRTGRSGRPWSSGRPAARSG